MDEYRYHKWESKRCVQFPTKTTKSDQEKVWKIREDKDVRYRLSVSKWVSDYRFVSLLDPIVYVWLSTVPIRPPLSTDH